MAPLGAHDMELGVLFADIRGFTSWCEGQTPEAIERALNAFYAVSTEVLAERDAIIDKLMGDEVMGLFLTAFPSLRSNACTVMVRSAQEILRRLRVSDPVLPVGIGLNYGIARVGNVGGGSVKDFTASETQSTRPLGFRPMRKQARSSCPTRCTTSSRASIPSLIR
jgi:adenylate cyclase